MNEDIDLDIEEEEEGGSTSPPEELTPEQKIAALEATVKTLQEKPDKTGDQMAQLLEMGKQFLVAQNTPKPQAVDTTNQLAQRQQFGKLLQETIISGDKPEAVTDLIMTAITEGANRQASSLMREFGTPMAEKAGAFAVSAFLNHKRDELGDAGLKTHQLVAKNFSLTPDEEAWVAVAKAGQVQNFLDTRYKSIAGDLLLKSAQRAKPRNISSGGGGGGGGNSNVLQFPGVSAERQSEIMKLAEDWWPDPKVRAEKIKTIVAEMTAEVS